MRASSSRLESGNPNPNREALPLSTMSVGITARARAAHIEVQVCRPNVMCCYASTTKAVRQKLYQVRAYVRFAGQR